MEATGLGVVGSATVGWGPAVEAAVVLGTGAAVLGTGWAVEGAGLRVAGAAVLVAGLAGVGAGLGMVEAAVWAGVPVGLDGFGGVGVPVHCQ